MNRSTTNYDVVIIGAGPGGLTCGNILAKHGTRVLILEKNVTIGKKVCAGGITWNGLIGRIPDTLFERTFPTQIVSTQLQTTSISSAQPIIATINRQILGKFMAIEAMENGAEIIHGAYVEEIRDGSLVFRKDNSRLKLNFDYLVGADGSMSNVRAFLGLKTNYSGVGINYEVPISNEIMEWHFDARRFGSGYTWIFPHKEIVSIGLYIGNNRTNIKSLNNELKKWAKEKAIKLSGARPKAEKINYDYQGWNFDNTYLVGDAAGLASPLTGEGIYPAFISGEAVARTIIDKYHVSIQLEKLLKKHQRHSQMQKLAGRSRLMAFGISEICALLLRFKFFD